MVSVYKRASDPTATVEHPNGSSRRLKLDSWKAAEPDIGGSLP